KGEKYHVLCSTKNSDEKIYQYLSTPNDRSDTKPAGGTGDAESEDVSDPGPMGGTGGTHSGLTMDTSWNLGYIYAGLACLEIQSDNDKVRALIWDKKIYRAFYWSASNKFLFCARPDSATVDKVGDPVNGSRLTSFHNWYTVSGENGKPFFEIMVDPQERTLFGLQENGEASSLLWGELQQPHATRAIPDGGGGAGVDFGLTRWLAMASAANASYVLGTPEGRSGVVKRFNIDKAVPTADISIPVEWRPRGKPVVITSGGKQYCCMTAQGEKGAWVSSSRTSGTSPRTRRRSSSFRMPIPSRRWPQIRRVELCMRSAWNRPVRERP
ncbi:hypothetical protein ACFXGA_09665, partial [Actinosynnema sp. NPDC059335]|uniref:hypothetical protein n=1 Tax=Actinosynnema sp. NPDC059335 TaxID=3346804 RepID=UPI0036709825